MRFVSAVLKDWYDRGLNTLEDIRAYEEKRAAEISALQGKSASLRRDNRDNFTLDSAQDDGSDIGTGVRMPRLLSETADEECD